MNIKSLSIAAILPFTLAACLIGEPPLSGTYVATEGMIVKSMTFEDSSVTVTGMMGQRSVGTVAYEDDTAILSIGNDKVPLKIEGDCISGNEGMMKMRLCKDKSAKAETSSDSRQTELPSGEYSGSDGKETASLIFKKNTFQIVENGQPAEKGTMEVKNGELHLTIEDETIVFVMDGNCLRPKDQPNAPKLCKV